MYGEGGSGEGGIRKLKKGGSKKPESQGEEEKVECLGWTTQRASHKRT